MSYKYSLTVVSLYAIAQSIQIGSNIWLKFWATNNTYRSLTLAGFLGIYATFIVAFILLNALVSYFAIILAIVHAAQRLHERLLIKVLQLPISFCYLHILCSCDHYCHRHEHSHFLGYRSISDGYL
jgi:ATP-binding cassette subfamily C (CFTR/MRP) protein 1